MWKWRMDASHEDGRQQGMIFIGYFVFKSSMVLKLLALHLIRVGLFL